MLSKRCLQSCQLNLQLHSNLPTCFCRSASASGSALAAALVGFPEGKKPRFKGLSFHLPAIARKTNLPLINIWENLLPLFI